MFGSKAENGSFPRYTCVVYCVCIINIAISVAVTLTSPPPPPPPPHHDHLATGDVSSPGLVRVRCSPGHSLVPLVVRRGERADQSWPSLSPSVSAGESGARVRMTVSPAGVEYWGPSQTFVSKVGGYRYVTDQYTALLSSIWGRDDHLEHRRRDRMVREFQGETDKRQPQVNRRGDWSHSRTPTRRRRLFRAPPLKYGQSLSLTGCHLPSLIFDHRTGHRRQSIPLPVSKPKYKYQHPRPRPRPPRPRPRPPAPPPPPPAPQPTPYQVRMGSTLGPLNTRIAQISG